MCAIHDHTRKNRFHPSLPACFCHTSLQSLQRYRNLIFQYLNGFHRKSCIHNLITGDKRYIKYGIAICLVLKRKPDSVLCDLMDLCVFPFQLIIWTSQLLCMLTHHSGRIRIISIVDHRNTRHHDPCLLSCDLGNRIPKILHMIQADGCDHTGCRILHRSGCIQTSAKAGLQCYIIHAGFCKDHHSHQKECLKIGGMIAALRNQLIGKLFNFFKSTKEGIVIDHFLVDLKTLVDLHQMRRCKKSAGISCFPKDRCDKSTGTSLSVGSCHMDHTEFPLRISKSS